MLISRLSSCCLAAVRSRTPRAYSEWRVLPLERGALRRMWGKLEVRVSTAVEESKSGRAVDGLSKGRYGIQQGHTWKR